MACPITEYLDINYKLGSSDRTVGLDCFTFCQYWLKHNRNIDLADVDLAHNRATSFDKNITRFNDWQKVVEPVDGCVALIGRNAPVHMGIYTGGGILHCIDPHGVIFNKKLDKFVGKVLGYYDKC